MIRFRLVLLAAAFGGAAVIGLAGAAAHGQVSRQIWNVRRPNHYRYTVTWSTMDESDAWRIEMRDGRVFQILQANGARLADRHWITPTRPYVLIDRLFQSVEDRTDYGEALGLLFIRALPDLNRSLETSGLPLIAQWARHNRCASPPPVVHYDSRWGFPTYARFQSTRTTMCGYIVEFGDFMEVQIEGFEPLP